MLNFLGKYFGGGRGRNDPPAELADARATAARLIDSIARTKDRWEYVYEPDLDDLPIVQEILAAEPESRLDILRAIIRFNTVGDRAIVKNPHPVHIKVLWRLVVKLVAKNLPYTDAALEDIFRCLSSDPFSDDQRVRSLVRALERYAARQPLKNDGPRAQVRAYADLLRSQPWKRYEDFAERLDRILDPVLEEEPPPLFAAVPETEWGQKIRQRLGALNEEEQAHWHQLLMLASNAVKQNRPRKRWKENASRLVKTIGEQAYAGQLVWMFEIYEFSKYSTRDPNAEILRGLVWASMFAEYHAPVAELGWFAAKCYDERLLW